MVKNNIWIFDLLWFSRNFLLYLFPGARDPASREGVGLYRPEAGGGGKVQAGEAGGGKQEQGIFLKKIWRKLVGVNVFFFQKIIMESEAEAEAEVLRGEAEAFSVEARWD